MHYSYMKKAVTLLLVSSAMTLFTSVDAQDCDAQGLLLEETETGPCEMVAGVCPSTCKDAVDSFHTTCSMVGATYNDYPYEASTDLLYLSVSRDDDDACKDVLLDKALLEIPDTCQDWYSMILIATLNECNRDALPCPQFCMDVLDGFYRTCSSEPIYASALYDAHLSEYLSDTCSAYRDTKVFTETDTPYDGGDTFELPDDPEFQDCNEQVQVLLDETETGPCKVVAGVCPSTCKDAVDSFLTTCSMALAAYDGGIPYEASSTVLIAILTLLKDDNDACKGVLLDKAQETADTCQDWAMLNFGASSFECNGDALECPQYCMAMLDGFYGTCSSEASTSFFTNESQSQFYYGFTNGLEGWLGSVLSDTCSAYQDTKVFTGTGTISNTGTTSAGASISLFATTVFVAVASVAISL